ncbi:unnamed protein product [Caenorhabditis bovis]|uniref:FAM69 protein-kinase domain-containing protein n=1 Tax=Caenorhabditis bovis TaxID=2654633 RepID=A0A8S1EYR7_9PELO|nr:unnamed protein product [Caenorhabditis bovis]
MEIIPMHYGARLDIYDDYDDDDEANGRAATEYAGMDHDECLERCDKECGEEAWRIACCSHVGRIAILVMSLLLVYLIYSAFSSTQVHHLTEAVEPRHNLNLTRANEILTALCDAYERGDITGDSCNRLCYDRNWVIRDFYDSNKVAIMIKDGGQTAVFKSQKPFIEMFEEPHEDLTNEQFYNKVVDLVNDELMLGWPKHYSKHLLETVWPTLLRTRGQAMSKADRRSLWALLQQPEFVLFRVLPLTRVTPKIIGTCGHMYQPESLVAFRMKGYYTNLKSKILVHLMGTLKLLYEFLDEPLQWCDVRFDNLGLSADYPKRFVLMDGDMVYTKSRLNSLFKNRPCQTDADCSIGDCSARCQADMTCSTRNNGNLEVFCEKLVNKLYNNKHWKNNKYLVACRDTGRNITQRLNELRLAWVWNLPDVVEYDVMPEYGPFDEEEPLIEPEKPLKVKTLVTAVGLTVVVFTLLISTVAFASLYFHLLNQNSSRLPKWPKPSISPLGKYSKAGVAADHEMCSEIGRKILLSGGNAVDAAIATTFCVGVLDTQSAGLGGGHFMTIYNATTTTCAVVDAREVAPLAATERMYVGKWNESRVGWRAIAVPGELHGLRTAFDRFGSRAVLWDALLKPTIEILEEGYPTSHALAKALKQYEEIIKKEPTMKQFVNPKTGKVYMPGEQIQTRKNLLETFKRLANSSDPIAEFYDGKMSREMVAEFRRNGGILTLDDFKSYASIVHDSSEVIYTQLKNGRIACGPPPPSGSAVAQAILNVMDGFEYNMKSFDDIANLYHHFIEASKFSYAARSWLGDPKFVANATQIAKNITTKQWAENVRSKITETTHDDSYYGGSFEAPPQDHGTAHISVIDADGNAVSITTTINLYLGALVTSESTGILWNNEMDDFSTPGHPNFFGFPPSPANFIRPGKRPMSSQSPIVIFDEKANSNEILAVGGAGGSTIISGVAGVALHALWLKADVKQAVDAPRMHNQLQPNYTWYEPNFPKAYIKSLEQRGHSMRAVNNLTVVTAVERGNDFQIYANSDFRKGEESAPAGY